MKMRQIIQEQDEKKEEKDKVKARQKRLGEIASVLRTERSLKPKNKRSHSLKNILSGATNTIQPDSPEEEELRFLFYNFYFTIFYMRMI